MLTSGDGEHVSHAAPMVLSLDSLRHRRSDSSSNASEAGELLDLTSSLVPQTPLALDAFASPTAADSKQPADSTPLSSARAPTLPVPKLELPAFSAPDAGADVFAEPTSVRASQHSQPSQLRAPAVIATMPSPFSDDNRRARLFDPKQSQPQSKPAWDDSPTAPASASVARRARLQQEFELLGLFTAFP